MKNATMFLQDGPIDLAVVDDIREMFFAEIEYAVKALKEKQNSGITLTAKMVPTEFKDKNTLTSGAVVTKVVERMSPQTRQQLQDTKNALEQALSAVQKLTTSNSQHLSPPSSRDSSPVRDTTLAPSDKEPRAATTVTKKSPAGKRKSNTTPATTVTKKSRKTPIPKKVRSNNQIATSEDDSDSSCTEISDDEVSDLGLWEPMSPIKPLETSAQEHIPVSSKGRVNDLVPTSSCQNQAPVFAQNIPVQEMSFDDLIGNGPEEQQLQNAIQFLENDNSKEVNTPPN